MRLGEKIFTSPERELPTILRYAAATLFILIAFALRYVLKFELGGQLPFTFFLTSAILAAWFGGVGPGVYALVFGFLLGDYFFLPPVGSIGGYGKMEWATLISTLVPSLVAIALIESLHRARRRVKAQTESLSREILKRKKAEEELLESQREIRGYAARLETQVQERTVELEKSVKFLESYCYSIAHDLRAPLRAMQGFVHVMVEDYGPALDEVGRDYAGRIGEASKRMDKLILDLLDYGRLHHVKLEWRELRLDTLVEGVLGMFAGEMRNRKAEIHVDSPLGKVWADPNLAEQVVKNLISNALEFIPRNIRPEIRIWAEDHGNNIRLLIQDNGIGIEPQHKERIFKVFERLDSNSTSATGIGLAIVSKAIERMKGSVGVISEQKKGSTFWIELRKAASDPVSSGSSGSIKLEKETEDHVLVRS